MRIATAFFHDRASSGITARQADVYETQNRLASGRRIATAADDPVGAALAVRQRGALAENERWLESQTAARTSLSLAESNLGAMGDAIASARDTVIAAGSPTLSASDRRTLAGQLRHALEQVTSLANATDGDGSYLFAGFDNRSAPFVQNGTTVSYGGDSGQRWAEVGPGVRIPVTEGGDELFMRIPDGNGVFSVEGDPANAGSGQFTVGRVANAAALTGHTYEVRFGAGGTTYDVWDVTAAAAVSAGNAYTAGQTITVAGMAFEVKGAPAAGDKFTLAPSQVASVFDRLSRAIAALEDGATGPAASARLTNELGVSLQGLDRALDRVLDARGAAGNALNRLDTLTGLSQDREVATSAQLSAVEDLDYAKAASELTLRTTALEAALAAYSQTAKRSLFDYL